MIEVFTLMEVCFIVFPDITNRAVYIKSICFYFLDTGKRKNEVREKRVVSINNTDNSDERACSLLCCLDERLAAE